MKQHFMPSNDAGKELWLKNFAAKLSVYAAKYNLTEEEVADMVKSALYFTYLLDYKNQYNDYVRKLTDFKNEIRSHSNNITSVPPDAPEFVTVPELVKPGIFVRANSLAKRIKGHVNYTTADGNDLNIESTAIVQPDVDSMKPELKIKLVQGGHPQLNWKKNGMDALEIHVDRDGEGFFFLDIDMKPNFVDEMQLPETPEIWRYKAIYKRDNKYTGQWSDIISVVVAQL
ncbi:MAG TPA: hypothetical protein PK431_12855 [Chitinophagales bacterium]|nr:hypothetical protein [Chitinophagales bacterium]